MMALLRNRFLEKVWKAATILGHDLSPWEKDKLSRYFAVCAKCQMVVTCKVSMRLHDMPETPCSEKKDA